MTPEASPKKRHWRRRFIKSLSIMGNVRRACLSAGVDRRWVYRSRERSSRFAAAWDRALDSASDVLEAEAWRRAVKGVSKPTTVAKMREMVQEYSDTLLIFLLKGAKPSKFRDHATIEHKGEVKVDHKIAFNHDDYSKAFTDFARRHGLGTAAPNGN